MRRSLVIYKIVRGRRSTRMHKRKLTWLLLILLLLSSACLSARDQQTQEAILPLPVRPSLEVQVQENGGICLDKQDTLELLLYSQELERRL